MSTLNSSFPSGFVGACSAGHPVEQSGIGLACRLGCFDVRDKEPASLGELIMRPLGLLASAVAVLALTPPLSFAAEEAAGKAKASDLVDRGISYLAGAQADDGSWSKQAGPGITALIAAAFLENGRSTSDPVVAKALKYVESHVRPD